MNEDPAREREWLSVAEFRKRHPALGKNLIYDAVREGRIPAIRIRGKILIPSDALDQMLSGSGTHHDEGAEPLNEQYPAPLLEVASLSKPQGRHS